MPEPDPRPEAAARRVLDLVDDLRWRNERRAEYHPTPAAVAANPDVTTYDRLNVGRLWWSSEVVTRVAAGIIAEEMSAPPNPPTPSARR